MAPRLGKAVGVLSAEATSPAAASWAWCARGHTSRPDRRLDSDHPLPIEAGMRILMTGGTGLVGPINRVGAASNGGRVA